MDAIRYSQVHLSPFGSTKLHEISQAMALLALGSRPVSAGHAHFALLSDERWAHLTERFTWNHLTVNALTASKSLLDVALTAGLSALKTKACAPGVSLSCPVCSMADLTAALPFAQTNRSSLVCWVTGKVMTDENWPVVLPSGYVYSREAVEGPLARDGDLVYDPRASTTYLASQVRKAFLA
jgi:macrophage erythroblast attacher